MGRVPLRARLHCHGNPVGVSLFVHHVPFGPLDHAPLAPCHLRHLGNPSQLVDQLAEAEGRQTIKIKNEKTPKTNGKKTGGGERSALTAVSWYHNIVKVVKYVIRGTYADYIPGIYLVLLAVSDIGLPGILYSIY